jgi:hypothetical protein
MTWVMHSSSRTVPGGAIEAVSIVVSDLMTGPSLVNELSLMRRPTPLLSGVPWGATVAWVPSP